MIVDKLRQEIALYDKPENRINYQQFFKEKLERPFGLKTPILRKISSRLFRNVKSQPKKQILDLCDELLILQERYFRFFAFEWAIKVKDQYVSTDFARFERWLKKYVDNWGTCDHLCCGPIGNVVWQYPESAVKTKKWIPSKNRWLRRAAAVSLIIPVRHRLLLDEVFATADKLLTDSDDMVQKGYGWMLKVAGDQFPDEVFDYVMKNKADMPRTSLRYAIEKYPANKRKLAMKR